jgi:hypothetical protein
VWECCSLFLTYYMQLGSSKQKRQELHARGAVICIAERNSMFFSNSKTAVCEFIHIMEENVLQRTRGHVPASQMEAGKCIPGINAVP